MTFYDFGDHSSYEKKWVFAASIHPKSHVVKWYCPECGRAAQYPAGAFDVTMESGFAFPDFLGSGAFPLLIVSERIISDWGNAGITDFRRFPVGIADIKDSRAQKHNAPQYFRIEVTGECMVDFVRSGAAIESVCSRCATIKMNVPYIKNYSLFEGSWDGSQLFRDHRFFPSVTFCTEKVRELAQAQRHTNVHFEKLA